MSQHLGLWKHKVGLADLYHGYHIMDTFEFLHVLCIFADKAKC